MSCTCSGSPLPRARHALAAGRRRESRPSSPPTTRCRGTTGRAWMSRAPRSTTRRARDRPLAARRGRARVARRSRASASRTSRTRCSSRGRARADRRRPARRCSSSASCARTRGSTCSCARSPQVPDARLVVAGDPLDPVEPLQRLAREARRRRADRVAARLSPGGRGRRADARRSAGRPAVPANRRLGRARHRDRPRPARRRHRRRLARRDRARLRRSARSSRPATQQALAAACSAAARTTAQRLAAAFAGTRVARAQALTWDAAASEHERVYEAASRRTLELRVWTPTRAEWLAALGVVARARGLGASRVRGSSTRTSDAALCAPGGRTTGASSIRSCCATCAEPFGVDGHDTITPYGYGGPFFWGGERDAVADAFWHAFDAWAAEQRVVSEFVRLALFDDGLLPVSGRARAAARQRRPRPRPDADALWMDFEHKVRKNVKKARRSGVRVEFDADRRAPRRLPPPLRAHARPARGAPSATASRARSSRRSTRGSPASSSTRTRCTTSASSRRSSRSLSERSVYSFLGGTASDAYELRPNDLLKYELILLGEGRRQAPLRPRRRLRARRRDLPLQAQLRAARARAVLRRPPRARAGAVPGPNGIRWKPARAGLFSCVPRVARLTEWAW